MDEPIVAQTIMPRIRIGTDISTKGVMPQTNSDRFWRKVDIGSVECCWEWKGGCKVDGYGVFSKRIGVGDYMNVIASRFAYEDTYRVELGELQADHLCRNKLCCNPIHLEGVTRLVNMRRSKPFRIWKKKTHCAHGHPFTQNNTYIRPLGSKECRICRSETMRKFYKKKEK